MSFIRENDVTICIDHFFISIAIDYLQLSVLKHGKIFLNQQIRML